MRCLYLITARGGSKGIPHKNMKLMNGKPLINYSIEMARRFVADADICVSTDDVEIKRVAEETGLEVPFLRPNYLASDTASSSDVIVHALKWYEEEKGIKYDTVVLFQPTSPLRRYEDVENCLSLYEPNLDMVTTVKASCVSSVLCKENEEGFLEKVIGKSDVRRQDAAKLYEYNGAVYVINAEAVKQKGLGGFTKIKKSVMPEINSLDIDTMTDWYMVESLLEKKVVEL